LRRRAQVEAKVSVYRAGELTIDLGARLVTLGSEKVRLSPKEFALLTALAASAGQVVTHRKLLLAGWGAETADTQYLRVYIGLLRQKIEADPSDPRLLLSEPGVGYRLSAG